MRGTSVGLGTVKNHRCVYNTSARLASFSAYLFTMPLFAFVFSLLWRTRARLPLTHTPRSYPPRRSTLPPPPPPSYDVELERAKKPCLKAVLQGDASAARPMILCVSRVYTQEEVGTRHGGAAAIVEVYMCVCACGFCVCVSCVRT